jgi:preprotein translocase subunit SecY
MFRSIADTFANCFKIPELKSRIFFTLIVLGICRLISMIPVPGLDGIKLTEFMSQSANSGGVLGMYSLFTGGALERCAVGSLGIMPYISATIIIQLLSAVIPSLSKLAREEGGRTKIVKYGRYLTVLLCLGQGLVMAIGWENAEKIFNGFPGKLVLYENVWWYRIQTTILLTTGTLLLMWLGEQITERGIGNGISLVITIGILARLPAAGQDLTLMFAPPDGDPKYNLFPRSGPGVAVAGGHCGSNRGNPGAAENPRAIRATHGGSKDLRGRQFVYAVASQLRRRDAHHFCASHPDVPTEDPAIPGG